MRIAAAACLLVVTAAASTVPAVPALAAADITEVCAGTDSGTTFTLTADCDTTQPLLVPDGYTLNGDGHQITAHDPGTGPGGGFMGPVVTNEGGTMRLENLTVRGTGFANDCNSGNPTVGVLFLNASGAMSDVKVLGITQHTTCMYLHAIMIESQMTQQTVDLTKVTAADFQRTGLLVRGKARVHVTGSTFGPPDLHVPNPGRIAQNSVQIGSGVLAGPTGGTFTGNHVIGTAFGGLNNASTAMLLVDTTGLTVSRNTFSGVGTDHGISLWGIQHDAVISRNQIDRSTEHRADFRDHSGYGVLVRAEDFPQTGTKLICNTFSGWNRNLNRITQPPCIATEVLHPCATLHKHYSQKLQVINADPEATPTWRVLSGELPRGLTLHSDGQVRGTPTEVGARTARVEVTSIDGHASGDVRFCVAAG